MVDLLPHRLYEAEELCNLLSKRTIERLRTHGMVAIGGRYLGQNVLDAWLRMVDLAWKTRRGIQANEQEVAITELARPITQQTPKPRPGVSLKEQLERSRRNATKR